MDEPFIPKPEPPPIPLIPTQPVPADDSTPHIPATPMQRGGPPAGPALKPMGPEPNYRQLGFVKRRYPQDRISYLTCQAKGIQRIADMAAPQRAPRPPETFGKEYRTEVVDHPDSPTGKALVTTWTGTALDHGYKNTPIPELGILRSWQNKSVKGEPLTNTDVYFYQYVTTWRSERGDAPLPRLKRVQRQQAANEVTTEVLNAMRWVRDDGGTPVGTFGPESDDFAALLGTPNGTAPWLLVVHYGDQLGISRITSIEVTPAQDFVFSYA